MGNYTLKMYTPDLAKQVCALQKQLWSPSLRLNAAYLDWKHFRNPYFEEPLIYVALHQGRLVGMRAMFGTCWEAGDYVEKIVLPSAADIVIEPDYRNSGLYQDLNDFAMADLRARGFHHVLNLSPTPSNYVASVMSGGWRPMGSSEEMTRGGRAPASAGVAFHPASMPRSATRARDAGLAAGRKLKAVLRISAYAALDRNARDGKSPLRVFRQPRQEVMGELVRQIGGDGRLRHVRDSAYFSWRFGNPRYCYRFLFWGGENPAGYMVLQNTVGHRQVNVVDWEGRDARVRSDLLEAALRLGEFQTMGTWGIGLPNPAIEALQKVGFTHTAAGPSSGFGGRFMCKLLDPDAENSGILGRQLQEPGNWDLRMIYSDNA